MHTHPISHNSSSNFNILRKSQTPWRKIGAAVLATAIALSLSQTTVFAATSIKQNNTTNLNLSGSWNTLPGAADIAQWDATVLAANSPVLGGDLSWLGLKIVGPGGLVTLGAGNTLTLGASGIDLSTATQSLTLNCGLTLQGKQSWQAAASRTLNIAGTFTRAGAVVDFTSFNATATLGTLANDASGILGSWAITGSGTTLNYAKTTAGVVSAFTTQTAATAADLSNATNPAVNYSAAAAATQIGNISANTLRYTGGSNTLANGGFTSTLNGLLNAGTGTLTVSGAGNLVIGANRELVIVANTQATTFTNTIVNNAAGASSVTYSGESGGILTLSAVNTYSGGTTVNAGAISPYGNGSGSALAYLGTGTVTMNGGTTLKPTDASGQPVDLNNAFLLNAGTVSVLVPFGGGTDIKLHGTITGPGGFSIGGGTRWLALYGTNTFSGGVILNDGSSLRINAVGALGTGTLSLGNTAAGGLVTLTNLSGGQVPNTIDLTSGRLLTVDTSSGGLNLAGMIQNTGGLTKNGGNTLTLSGANTYTGATKVTGGTLALSSAGSLGGGALDITTGATVALNFTGTRHITVLTFNAGAAQAAGTYGATGSGATNTSTNFSGTGTLTVGGAAFAVTTTTLALTNGSTPAAVGASLTFTATVAGTSPTGNVAFYDGITLLSTVALNGSFQAAFTTTSLALGTHPITARYVGNTANDPSVSAVMSIQISNPTDILTFTFPGLPATTITGTNITVTVPFSTNVTALSPTYTLAFGGTCVPASGATLNFTGTQNYVVSASGFADKTYAVTVTKAAASTAKDITAFSFPGLPVTTIGTNTVSVTVPFGTSVTNLSPTYSVSALASGSPISGTVRNFSTPQTYTITAEDNSTKVYTVTVTIAPASSANTMLTCDFGALGAATITGTNAILTVIPTQPVTALAPTFTFSPLATISPASGSTQNFTNPVTYTVTAQNGATQNYSVAVQSYESWAHTGSMFIITTPEGANIAAGGTETDFPLLVRLNSGNFNFAEAQSDGRDIRFTTPAGVVLPYQIEQWDVAGGTASIWVKIPTIAGNARQEIKMYWGKAGVATESNGPAVFNATNGYATVIHMNETVQDVVGSVTPTNTGTTLGTGMIGKGRNFTAGTGIWCGDTISTFSQGGVAHSTEAWFRTSAVNCEVVDWGVEGGTGAKVQIRVISPPRIYVDGNFASVTGTTTLDATQWHHVVHTYTPGSPSVSRIYVDGQLDASANVTMNLPNPARMWIGGWYNSYAYVGDIDEVRISKVARSANWIKLQYENQKPLQTLLGTLVQAGSAFSASPSSVTFNEGTSTSFTGQAGGAQKVYWIRKQGGVDTVLAVDTFSLSVAAGRVTGNQSFVIQFKGIYAGSIQTVDIPVTITEDLPDPVFTLSGPTTWDGRQTIAVTSNITNLTTLQAKGVATINYNWSVNGVAVTKTTSAGTLTLLRAQGNGPMVVTLVMDNGGSLVTVTKTITVQQPASDAWVQRTPVANEKPVNNQFFARDDTGFGKIFYSGTQAGSPDTVYIKVYTTDTGSDVQYGATLRQALVSGAYSFTAPIAGGLVTYKVVYGTTTGGVDTPVGSAVTNLICGDAYIIEGQSNAVATAPGAESPTFSNAWIRTYAASGGWGNASQAANSWQIGYWGVDLALKLLTAHNMPICIMNGSVGGTRIDEHQPNPADHAVAGSLYSIYANLYTRVVAAKLTHGIRGVLWHQGEQDQGSGAPTGDYDYKTYQQYFVDMSASWKQDYPNILNYYVFQIWPSACGDTSRNDLLREVQRTLPYLFSNMRIMTTVGIVPGSSCHYVPAGYQKFCDLISPFVQQDNYGLVPAGVITAPDVKRAYFTTAARNEIAVEYGQAMLWSNLSKGLFYLDGVASLVSSGSVAGNVVKLQLTATSSAQKITYLVGGSWDSNQTNIVYGTNNIAALTFADVPIGPPVPTGLAPTAGNSQVTLNWAASAGATGYNIKRALTSGGPYTVIGTTVGTSYTDNTVTNGTTYYYVVSATNGLGESVDSSQVTAIPSVLPSTTTLASSLGATGAYGSTVTFTATVAVTGGPATGTVTFKDGVTVLGTGALSAGATTFATSTLAMGAHSITATYGGDTTFATSVSSAFAYSVTAKPVTITGVTASNKVYDNTTTATLSGGAVSGVVSGETVTVVAGTGTFASANAGTRAVTATGYSLGGANAGNYTLSAQPTVPNATITARPVQLTGTRAYDGTAAAGTLSFSNNLDAGNLTLTGSASLLGKDVGTQVLITSAAGAARVQSAKGNTGTNAATTISVNMGATPVAGNTLVAVISTRGTSANIVSSITQTGVPNGTWMRASQANNTSMTTEIWYAPNVPSGAGTAVTINQTSFLSAAVVMEYSGVLVANTLDQIAPGNSVATSAAAVTGTTATTSQANELWIGGIGFADSTPTLGTILNSFAAVDNAVTTNATTTSNARVYALERIVSSTGTASSGGTISASTQWTGTIATFKAATSTLALAGSAAANYTLTGATGTGQITARSLTVTASNQSKTYGQTVTFGSGSTQFTSSGLQNGETIGSVTLACTGGGAAAAVATYSLTPSAAIGGTFAASNYSISYVAGTFTVNMAPTTTTVASSLSPATVGVSVTFTATVTGGTPTGNVTFYDGATALGTSALNGSFQTTLSSSSLTAGTHSITAQYAGNANYAASTSTVLSQVIVLPPFDAWASDPANGLTAGVNDGPLADPDGDGICNLLEFALGGSPMTFGQAVLPTLTPSGNNLLFEYNRSDLSLSPVTTQVVEYGSDLAGWTTVAIPTTSFDIVTITPGTPSDHVAVTIPISGSKTFVRLKVTK